MEGEGTATDATGEADQGSPEANSGQKVWHVVPIPGSFGLDVQTEAKVRHTGASIRLIGRKALDENDVTIVGSMLLSKAKEPDAAPRLACIPCALLSGQGEMEDALFALRSKYKFTRTVGYLPTGQEGCYVRVVRRNWLLAIIPILLAAAIAALLLLFQNGGIPWLNMDPNQTDPWDANQATRESKDTISVDGVSAIRVDSTHATWPLKNPAENTSYFKYTCTCDGNTLFESDWVEPGKAVPFNVYEALGSKAGTYTVNVKIATRDMNTHAEQNGAEYDVEVTVY